MKPQYFFLSLAIFGLAALAGGLVGTNLVDSYFQGADVAGVTPSPLGLTFANSTPLLTAPQNITGTKKIAIVLIHFQDSTSTSSFSLTDISQITSFANTTPGDSLYDIFRRSSFNQLTLVGGVTGIGIYGPVTIPYDHLGANGQGHCSAETIFPGLPDYKAWADAAQTTTEDQYPGTFFKDFDTIINIIPADPSCQFTAGITYFLNNSTRPRADVVINGWVTYNNRLASKSVMVHELGHSFGLHHSTALDCVNSINQPVQYSASCVMSNPVVVPPVYADPFDPMGASVPTPDFSVYHKWLLGWLAAFPNGLPTVTQSGSFNITAIEQTGGTTYGLCLPLPPNTTCSSADSSNFYVEKRTGRNVVLVRLAPYARDDAAHDGITDQALLDSNPATVDNFNDAFLSTGATFLDPASGIQIKPTTETDTTATIRVDFLKPHLVQVPQGDLPRGAPITIRVSLDGVPNGVKLFLNNQEVTTGWNYTPSQTVYDYPWDITFVPNGSYTFQAVSVAADGRLVKSDPLTVSVQSHRISITSPTAGQTLSGIQTFTAQPGISGWSSLRFTQDGNYIGNSQTPQAATSIYNLSWDTRTSSNGSHAIGAQLLYTNGTIVASSTPVTVTYNNLPTVSVTAPTAGQTLSGITTFTAATVGAFTTLRFTEDGNYIGNFLPYNSASNIYSITRNTKTVANPNGPHQIGATLFATTTPPTVDVVATSSPVTVTYNNPTVILTAPTAGGSVTGDATLMAKAAGVFATLHFTKDGSQVGTDLPYQPTNSTYSLSVDTRTWSNGNHTLGVALLNASSAIVATSSPVTVSCLNIPTVTIIAPANNASVSGIITLTATTTGPFAYLRFLPDGSQAGAPGALVYQPTNPVYTTGWDSTPWAGVAPHTFVAQLLDTNGTTVLASNTISITSNNPSVTITAPANNATVSGNITLTVSTTGTFGFVRFSEGGLYIGNELPYHATPSTYSLPRNTTTQPNGWHTLQAVLLDANHNPINSSPVITVNYNNAATVNIVAPINGGIPLHGNWTITSNTTGSFASIRYAQDGNILGTQPYQPLNPTYNFVWDTRPWSDGKHYLLAELLNASGAVIAGSNEVVVQYNNGVTATITAPSAGTTLHGTWTFTADTTGVFNSLRYTQDNVPISDVGQYYLCCNSTYGFIWDTTPWPNGSHTIRAELLDLYGYVIRTSNPVTVTYNNATHPPINLPPVLSIRGVPQPFPSSGTVQLIVTAYDADGIYSVGLSGTGVITTSCPGFGATTATCSQTADAHILALISDGRPAGTIWAYDNTPSRNFSSGHYCFVEVGTPGVFCPGNIAMPVPPTIEPDSRGTPLPVPTLAPSVSPLPVPTVEPEKTPLSIPDSDQVAAVIAGFWQWLGKWFVLK